MPTYKKMFDKLTAAYINNEVNPFKGFERYLKDINTSFYTPIELMTLKHSFMTTYIENGGRGDENALFKAFKVTLDLLKQIHKNKGENVDSYPFNPW